MQGFLGWGKVLRGVLNKHSVSCVFIFAQFCCHIFFCRMQRLFRPIFNLFLFGNFLLSESGCLTLKKISASRNEGVWTAKCFSGSCKRYYSNHMFEHSSGTFFSEKGKQNPVLRTEWSCLENVENSWRLGYGKAKTLRYLQKANYTI